MNISNGVFLLLYLALTDLKVRLYCLLFQSMKKFVQVISLVWLVIFTHNCFAQGQAEGEHFFKIAYDHLQKGEYQKAIDNFTLSARYIPKGENIYFLRGQAKLLMGYYYQAITDYDSAIILRKDMPDFYNARAWAYCFTGKYVQATWDADKAIALRKAAEYYDTRATAYGLRISVYSAINDFDTAIKLSPKPLYYYKRGLIKKVKYDSAGAQQDFAMAKKLDATEKYKKENDPLFNYFTEQYFAARKNKAAVTTPAATSNAAPKTLNLQKSDGWVSVDDCSIIFPGKPEITSSASESFSTEYVATFQKGDELFVFRYLVITPDKYERAKETDLLKNLREAYAKVWSATIADLSFFIHRKMKVAATYTLKKANSYARFIDGRTGNKIYYIGIFNSKRFPTFEELKMFENWFYIKD